MSDIQAKFDEYKSKFSRAPSATQLAKYANVKYSQASAFLRNSSNSNGSTAITRNTRSQTVSSPTSSFTSPTKPRSSSISSSFSNKVLYEDNKPSTSSPSSSTGIDYSGSTTGANNPWKKFQKKKSSASGSFTQSYTAPKPKTKPKPSPNTTTSSIKSKPVTTPKSRKAVKKSSPRVTTYSASSSISSINRSPRSTYNNSSSSDLNINALRSDLSNLNTNFERECNKIRAKFEGMRQELSRRENEIISNLSEYTDQCRSIIEGNISKMEKLAQSKVIRVTETDHANNYNGHYSRQISNETVESHDYVEIVHDTEEKDIPSPSTKVISESEATSKPSQPSQPISASTSSGIDYSGSTTGANNPWKKQAMSSSYNASYSRPYKSKKEKAKSVQSPETEEVTEVNPTDEVSDEAKKTQSTSSGKANIPKPSWAQKDVESDEWSEESEGSW